MEVTNPLTNLKPYLQEPCSVLTGEQLDRLGLPGHEEPGDTPLGRECLWTNSDNGASAAINWDTKTRTGLSGTYDVRGKYAFFKPLAPIDGLPAVAYGTTDRREAGACSVAVGVNDEVIFQANITLSRQKTGEADPCKLARIVGKMMVTTMRQGR